MIRKSERGNCEIKKKKKKRGCAQTVSRLLGSRVFVDTPNQTVSNDRRLS